ncbi:MAG: hypothetical protein JWO38_4876 [Gemmataceae bacterium]|nr:hypothetical protein [Gemmataceae bacterium]
MAAFVDADGKTWKLRITLGDLDELQAAGLDVEAVAKDFKLLAAIAEDRRRYGQVLWQLCEREAAAAGITPEQFARRFDGQALFDAAGAIEEAIVDFSQPPPLAKRFAELRTGAMDRVMARALTSLETILAGSDGPAGSSPASPGSTAAPGPSGNSSGPPTDGSAGSGPGSPGWR